MAYKNSNKLIKKANELVESRYKFDIWETRVFAKMITLIHKDDEAFKTYRIYIKELQEDFQLTKNKDAYKRLKDGARRLMRRIVKITYTGEEGEKVLETPVIIGLETLVAGKSFIDVSFHPNMKPFLLQLKSQFLMYDIRNILKISSVHSVRIYELLKQYEKIGYRTFLVEELKDILQVSDKYPLYANFKQRIIKKAQKDLKKYTDISFTFEETKKVRSVEKIKFKISKNFTDKDEVSEKSEEKKFLSEKNSVGSSLTESLRVRLIEEGITDSKTLDGLFESHEYQYIKEVLDKCKAHFKKNKNQVKNKAGYIIDALNKGYYSDLIKDEAEKLKKIQKRKIKEASIQEKENQLQKIKDSFYRAYSEKLNKLRNEYYDDDLLNKILAAKKNTPFYNAVKESLRTKESSKVLDAWVNDYLAEEYMSEAERDFNKYLEQNTPNYTS